MNGPQDQQPEDDEEGQREQEAVLLERMLPYMNRWDIVNLEEEIDGIVGQIKICLSCEDGKINLNKWYDFEKHAFVGANKAGQKSPRGRQPKQTDEYKEALNKVFTSIAQITKDQVDPKILINSLQRFLKDRTYQLLDVTELLSISEWEYFKDHVFYEPPLKEDDDTLKTRPIYLTDLFTIWTDEATLQPWLLSDSTLAVLGFPRAAGGDIMKREQSVAEWTKNFKKTAQWATDWDQTLGPVYGVHIKNVPKPLVGLFDPSFNPKVFSVISHGTIGGITQKVCAIIRKQAKGKDKVFFAAEKLYWI